MVKARVFVRGDDEEICPECKGEGWVEKKWRCQFCLGFKKRYYYDPLNDTSVRMRCRNCDGKGFLTSRETCVVCFGDGVRKKPIKFTIKTE